VFAVTDVDLAAADEHESPNYRRSKVKMPAGRLAWVYYDIKSRPPGTIESN